MSYARDTHEGNSAIASLRQKEAYIDFLKLKLHRFQLVPIARDITNIILADTAALNIPPHNLLVYGGDFIFSPRTAPIKRIDADLQFMDHRNILTEEDLSQVDKFRELVRRYTEMYDFIEPLNAFLKSHVFWVASKLPGTPLPDALIRTLPRELTREIAPESSATLTLSLPPKQQQVIDNYMHSRKDYYERLKSHIFFGGII